MNPTRNFKILLLVSTLLMTSLACNYARRQANLPADLSPQVTASLEGVDDIPVNAQGKFHLVLDEAQVTSLISKELSSEDTPVLQDPQVSLQNGQMVLTGNVNQAGLNADLEMVMDVGVTADGRPDVSLVSATVGFFSLPQNMLDNLSAQIKTAFESKIDEGIDKVFIESITIDGGEMVIEGHAR